MKTGGILVVSVLLVCVVLLFAARRGTLHDLRSDNEVLREKVEMEMTTVPEQQQVQGGGARAELAELSEEERHELLQLRGQVQPLRRQIQELTSRVERATIAGSNGGMRSAKREVVDQQAMATAQGTVSFIRSEPAISVRKRGSALGQQLQEYLRTNHGSLPEDLSKLGEDANANSGKAANAEFELMRSGTVQIEAEASTLVARQKLPTPMPDGKCSRLYVLANGHVLFGSLATNDDWASWEQRTQDRLGAKQVEPQ